jgi:IMP dehydrogenase/GMP reductase
MNPFEDESAATQDAYAAKFPLLGLTFDDVLLLPGETDVVPSEVDTTTRQWIKTKAGPATGLMAAAVTAKVNALATTRGDTAVTLVNQ